MLPGQPSHTNQATVQFLNDWLTKTGSDALPYKRETAWAIRSHLLDVTAEYPGLSINTDIYTHNNGSSARLLMASGTIPMYYSGTRYNVPVALWLTEDYPRRPPTAFLKPTPGMTIRPRHPHVDLTGLIDVPYLREWVFPASTLVDLCKQLSARFGENPPLFARPQGPASPVVQRPSPSPHPQHPNVQARYPPGPPGAPVARAQPSHAHAPGAGTPHAYPSPLHPSPLRQHPMAYPVASPAQADASANPLAVGPSPAHSSALGLPYRAPVAQPPAGGTGGRTALEPPPSYAGGPVPAVAVGRAGPGAGVAVPGGGADDPLSVFRRHAVQYLTKRLHASLSDYRTSSQRELEALHDTEAQLQGRRAALERGLEGLRIEKERLEAAVAKVSSKKESIESWLRVNDRGVEEVVVDDIFVAEDPLSQQLLDAAADDLAIDDTLDALEEPLHDRQVSLEDYLTHVKRLTRQQFMARALWHKIRKMQMVAQHGGPSHNVVWQR